MAGNKPYPVMKRVYFLRALLLSLLVGTTSLAGCGSSIGFTAPSPAQAQEQLGLSEVLERDGVFVDNPDEAMFYFLHLNDDRVVGSVYLYINGANSEYNAVGRTLDQGGFLVELNPVEGEPDQTPLSLEVSESESLAYLQDKTTGAQRQVRLSPISTDQVNPRLWQLTSEHQPFSGPEIYQIDFTGSGHAITFTGQPIGQPGPPIVTYSGSLEVELNQQQGQRFILGNWRAVNAESRLAGVARENRFLSEGFAMAVIEPRTQTYEVWLYPPKATFTSILFFSRLGRFHVPPNTGANPEFYQGVVGSTVPLFKLGDFVQAYSEAAGTSLPFLFESGQITILKQ